MSLDILHRDAHVVAINKPSGLLVHRSALASDRVTCVSLLREQIGAWVYPVHRLDRGASGVLLFALDSESASSIARQFANRTTTKRYLAVVRGWVQDSMAIDYSLDDDEVAGSPRVEAHTLVRRLDSAELPHAVGRYASARYSLVEAQPLTGRRHQIRRHLAHIRHPIIGDAVHGDGKHNRFVREHLGVDRLLLHACELAVVHPATGSQLLLRAVPTAELAALFIDLGWSDVAHHVSDT